MCVLFQPDYYRDAPHFRRVGDGPQYRLEIPRAKLDFTGAYSVTARNCHGEAKAVISLQIYAKGECASWAVWAVWAADCMATIQYSQRCISLRLVLVEFILYFCYWCFVSSWDHKSVLHWKCISMFVPIIYEHRDVWMIPTDGDQKWFFFHVRFVQTRITFWVKECVSSCTLGLTVGGTQHAWGLFVRLYFLAQNNPLKPSGYFVCEQV